MIKSLSLVPIGQLKTIIKRNPLNLDFDGLNFQRTFQNDEQESQNQREYVILKRAVEKNQLIADLIKQFQSNEFAKKFELPKYFIVDDDGKERSDEQSNNRQKKISVIRTELKRANAEIAELELNRRKAGINNLLTNNLIVPMVPATGGVDWITKLNIEAAVARQDFEDYVSFSRRNENDVNLQSVTATLTTRPRKKFPQTLKELNILLKSNRKEKRAARDRAVICNDFFKELGIDRDIKSVDYTSDSEEDDQPDIPSDTSDKDLSDDEEDGLNVGKKNHETNRFLLRNFQNKFDSIFDGRVGSTLRNRRMSTCQPRCDWLLDLCFDNKIKDQKMVKIDQQKKARKRMVSKGKTEKRGLSYYVSNLKASSSSSDVREPMPRLISGENCVTRNAVTNFFLSNETLDEVVSLSYGKGCRLSNACFPRSNQTIFPRLKQQLPLPALIPPTSSRKPAIKNYQQRNHKEDEDIENYPRLPLLRRPEDDIILKPNINDIAKNEANKLFKVRHHHHHREPVHHKKMLVEYEPQRPLGLLGLPRSAMNSKLHLNWDNYVELDSVNKNSRASEETCGNNEHGNDARGKEEFAEKMTKLHENAYEIICPPDEERKWYIDKEKLIGDLKSEVSSIKSCISSQTSSVCTNFTYDSGSLLLFDDKAIPMHTVRKNFIPFENVDRCRVRATSTDDGDKSDAAFYKVPFSGQLMEMRRLIDPPDTFYTMNTRTRNNLRQRLGIQELYDNVEVIMPKCNQRHTVNEFKLIRQKPFKLKTFRVEYRKFIRQKCINQLVRQLRAQRKTNVEATENVNDCRQLSKPFLFNLQQQAYKNYIEKIGTLAKCTKNTMILQNDLTNLIKKSAEISRKITQSEEALKENITYQRIHYLLKDEKWRELNDWESFESRYKTFRRIEENDKKTDAWDVKAFYESKDGCRLLQNDRIYPVENAQEFLLALRNVAEEIMNSELMLKINAMIKK